MERRAPEGAQIVRAAANRAEFSCPGRLLYFAFPVFDMPARDGIVFPHHHLFGHFARIFPGDVEMAGIGGGVQANLDRCGFCHISCSLEGRHAPTRNPSGPANDPARRQSQLNSCRCGGAEPTDGSRSNARTACKPDSVPGGGHRRWTAIHLRRLSPDACCCLPGSPEPKPLRGHAARDPYSALLPVGLAMPVRLPGPRWALTPPFHPCPEFPGGLFSVALSLGLPRPGVTRHRCFVESGLSSDGGFINHQRPSSHPCAGDSTIRLRTGQPGIDEPGS